MASENVKTNVKPGAKKASTKATAPIKTAVTKPVAAKTSTPTAAVPAATKKQVGATKTGKAAAPVKSGTATPVTSNKFKAKPAKAVAAVTAEPVHKLRKSKLVRDSFTIPDHEYKLIQTLKARAIQHGLPLKKSELIRAGILKLVALSDADFKKTISAVDIIKTGRPTKTK